MKIDYSNPVLIKLRSAGQRLGVLRPLVGFWRKFSGYEYEDGFDRYVVKCVEPSSVVWDIGANVGFFTEKFAETVGDSGQVVAFDPSPGCASHLQDKFTDHDNVVVEPLGITDTIGQFEFSVGSETDPTGGFNRQGAIAETFSVSTTTVDQYCLEHKSRTPNYIKLDVEGYEFEAIAGMEKLLSDSRLRAIFIEMHFLELSKRGLTSAPAQIVEKLKSKGFVVRWIDPSHLAAERS